MSRISSCRAGQLLLDRISVAGNRCDGPFFVVDIGNVIARLAERAERRCGNAGSVRGDLGDGLLGLGVDQGSGRLAAVNGLELVGVDGFALYTLLGDRFRTACHLQACNPLGAVGNLLCFFSCK